MLHIVLVLLKIIGILLASILGLLIFLILLVLFVPIRYGIRADNLNELRAEGKVSWLFRLLYIRITYLDEQLIIRLRLFGKIFYDSSNPRDKKQSPKKRMTKPPQKPAKRLVEKKEAKEYKEADVKKEAEEYKETVVKKVAEEEALVKKEAEDIKSENIALHPESRVENTEAAKERKQNKGEFNSAEIIAWPGRYEEIKLREPELKAAEIPSSYTNDDFDFEYDLNEDELEEPKKSIFARIKEFYLKIREFFLNIRNRLRNLLDNIRKLWHKAQELIGKWDKIKEFLNEDDNKKALSKSFVTIKRILKHVRPTRLKAEVEFGTGDPCTTGQALGVLAVFYSFYGKSVRIIPNFEEEILKGNLDCAGRIRLFTLLIIGIQLVLDKNFRNLLKNFKTLKEDL